MSLLERIGTQAEPDPRPPLHRRLAWPAAIALGWGSWYASESLRHRREDRSGYEIVDPVDPSSPDFRLAAEALTGHASSESNSVEVLVNGDRIFPAMLEAIRAAEHAINFETYVYWRGGIAEEFADALAERARAGVEVRVLMDTIGSAKISPKLIREMREAGANVVRFRPPKPHLINRAFNRTHRRVLVCDGEVGFTGGVGIAEEWTGDAEDPDHWRDTHVRVRGPVVRSLIGAFAEHWVEATGEALVGPTSVRELEAQDDGVAAQIVRSGSRVGDSTIEVLYFLAIASAKEKIELTAAYFSPRPPFVQALCDAAARGVEVRIIVPGPHIDKQLVRQSGRSVYEDLVECGVEVFEYCPTMLHAKTLVVDGCWSSIGTVNFDNRSFQLNEEITLCVFDGGVSGFLSDVFAHDMERSEPIDLERWKRRPLRQRVAERASALLRREL